MFQVVNIFIANEEKRAHKIIKMIDLLKKNYINNKSKRSNKQLTCLNDQ